MVKLFLRHIIFTIILAILSQSGHSQIIINEFISSNASGHLNTQTGKFSDWIEIYNTDPNEQSLEGYFISDDKNVLTKYSFPPDVTIPGLGYLIIYPDNLNYGVHLNFALSKDGEMIYLTGPNGAIHDFVEFGKQKPDVSYGRNPENPLEWVWFGEPTPGMENNSQYLERPTENSSPDLFPEAGFYPASVEVNISDNSDPTQVIRYTTDGSKPTSSSPVFPRTLTIGSTTTVKVRSFSSDKMPSTVIAKTYFIGEETDLPVFSISLNPEYLWDDDTGIYVDGSKFNGDRTSRNSCRPDWERPINIEFFEDNGQLIFSKQAGVQVKGRMNCEFPKKPLGVYFRSKYGDNQINYPFFVEKSVSEFSSFILRPGGADGMGNCYNGTMIRDGLLSTLLIDQMDIDYEAYRPAILFINGEYWGIHNIRERNKSDYITANHNLDGVKLDILENPSNGGVIKGDDIHYMGLLNLARSAEIDDPSGYEKVKELVDLQELLNYQIAEIFVNNEDWAHNNVLCWRPRTVDGKWRWVFFDVEGGFGLYHANDYTNNMFGFKEDDFLKHAYLFRRLMTNPRIKADFIQGFAAHLNTTFNTERVLFMIDSLTQDVINEMPKDVKRWSGHVTMGGSGCAPISSLDEWESHLEIMKTFARQRPEIIRQQIINRYDLSGSAILNLENEGGSITLNGVENSISGSYFKDISIRLEAIPDIGYKFIGWEGLSSDSEITIDLVNDTLIKAIFVRGEESILPSIISDKIILSADKSPYLATSDIIVEHDAVLKVNPGVKIIMPEKASIYVYGQMQIAGEPENRVSISSISDSGERWGAIVFDQAQEGSILNYLDISHASKGHKNSSLFKANLNIIGTKVPIVGLSILDSDKNPLYILNSEAIIIESSFHSFGTGDYINIAESPSATVESCLFFGNDAKDTDAIDLDEVAQAIVTGNKFKNFVGSNSDGIDVGGSNDVLIKENVFSSISDKGISVGKGSSIHVIGNIFLNCLNGVGIKDAGSQAFIDRNTFFSNRTGVKCFEKEPGRGGGSASIVNSIFAGESQYAGFADTYSSISYDYSLNEFEELPGNNNQLGDPGFISSTAGIFRLSETSVCRESGDPQSPPDPDGTTADIGAYYFHNLQYTDISLNEIIKKGDHFEIELFNGGESTIDCRELSLFLRGAETEINLSSFAGSDPYLAPKSFKLFSIENNNFSSDIAGDMLMLYQLIQDQKILLSSLSISYFLDSFSQGCFPDGSFLIRHFSEATPGWQNQADASGQGQIFINEILADNQNSNTNETNQFEDWVELFNAGDQEYDLGGMYFTDNLDNPTKHQIPAKLKSNSLMESRGFAFFWADGNSDAGPDHLNFRLDADKEELGLFRIMYPDTLLIDSLLFANQMPDKSYGRYPDGGSEIRELEIITPGSSNVYMHVADSQNIFDLTIYPNPCRDQLNVSLDGIISSDAHLELINLSGQVMARLNLSNVNPAITSLAVNHLPPGMYIVRVISNSIVKTARIIKE